MQIIHHGAKEGVTGSCHQLDTEWGSLLIDCGQFQGEEERPLEIDFALDDIDAVLLTHAHIDHIGRLPWLIAAGFNGPIYCTPATANLVPLMLDDGLRLQLGLDDQARDNIIGRISALIVALPYQQKQTLKRGEQVIADIRFQPAGHILGSSYIEITLPDGQVVVFSGDLGPSDTPLLPDPLPPSRADVLVVESTYGDREHESIAERAERLKALINRSLEDGGVILIPAFSVGRTQELLFDLEAIIATQLNADEKRQWLKIPIILDSPMAAKITDQYHLFQSLWGDEAKSSLAEGRHPLAFEQCVTIDSHKDHLALVNRLKLSGEPAIVVSASGMCAGGRIVNYLEALLPDARTDVIIAGFQAEGTLGRALQEGEREVPINGDTVEVNAHIHIMSGYSAHADRQDLVRFIQGIATKPREIRIVHGNTEAQQALADIIREQELAEFVVTACSIT